MPANNYQEEKQLFKQIAEGDEVAFRQLFDTYYDKLYKFLLRLVKSYSSADELTQDTFYKIWKNRKSLTEVEHPESYIFTIAKNKTIDHLRKIANEARLTNELWENITEARKTTDEIVEANESARLIDEALSNLTPQKRQIFRLSRYEGYTHEEIANELNLSKSTIKNNLVETLRFIKAFLKKHNTVIVFFMLCGIRK